MFAAEVADLLTRLDRSRIDFDDRGMSFCFQPARPLLIGAVRHAREDDLASVKTRLKGLLPVLRAAHPFRFMNIPGFAGDQIRDLPVPDREGRELFDSSIVRPPFEVCWYEMAQPLLEDDGLRRQVGLLVETKGNEVRTYHFERYGTEKSIVISVPAYGTSVLRGTGRMAMYDPHGIFERISPEGLTHTSSPALFGALCIYLTLILASNRKTVEIVKPGLIERRRRSDKGLSPLKDVHVVTMPADWRPGEVLGEEGEG